MGFLENAKDSEQPVQTANILKFKKGLRTKILGIDRTRIFFISPQKVLRHYIIPATHEVTSQNHLGEPSPNSWPIEPWEIRN